MAEMLKFEGPEVNSSCLTARNCVSYKIVGIVWALICIVYLSGYILSTHIYI